MEEPKDRNLVKCLPKGSGDGIADLSSHVLLLCDVLHQIIDLANVPGNERREREIKRE